MLTMKKSEEIYAQHSSQLLEGASTVIKDLYMLMLTISIFCSDYLFKVLMIGNSGVGKSCLLLRFAVSSLVISIFHSMQISNW